MNKQYEKEERERLAALLFKSMEAAWTYGKFFPVELCPFVYEDTLAGLMSNNVELSIMNDELKLESGEIATSSLAAFGINEYDILLDKVIVDTEGKKFKFMKQELEFLKQHALPLPQKHWLNLLKSNLSVYL